MNYKQESGRYAYRHDEYFYTSHLDYGKEAEADFQMRTDAR
jgi:hypothetical protein